MSFQTLISWLFPWPNTTPSPSSTSPSIPNHQKRKQPRRNLKVEKRKYRTLRSRVLSRNSSTPVSALARALQIYDPGLTFYHPASPEMVDELEEIFGLGGVEWSSDVERARLLEEKVDRVLKGFCIRWNMYREFSYYGENGRWFLVIGVADGRIPPLLPGWLRIPYLVHAECRDMD